MAILSTLMACDISQIATAVTYCFLFLLFLVTTTLSILVRVYSNPDWSVALVTFKSDSELHNLLKRDRKVMGDEGTGFGA